jgi:hypothetical protein
MNIGQTVKVIPEVRGFSGMVGIITAIDPHNTDEGDFYGVKFTWSPLYYMFNADELTVIEGGDAASNNQN